MKEKNLHLVGREILANKMQTEKKLVPSEEKGAMPCEAKDSEMRVFIQ